MKMRDPQTNSICKITAQDLSSTKQTTRCLDFSNENVGGGGASVPPTGEAFRKSADSLITSHVLLRSHILFYMKLAALHPEQDSSPDESHVVFRRLDIHFTSLEWRPGEAGHTLLWSGLFLGM